VKLQVKIKDKITLRAPNIELVLHAVLANETG
jgi:hypothetical protein